MQQPTDRDSGGGDSRPYVDVVAPAGNSVTMRALAQVVDEAVKLGVLAGNPVRAVKPLRITDTGGVALTPDEARALLDAARDHRLSAPQSPCCFCRVGEDLDLDAGTAQVRRASVYVDGRGQQLGPPKTDGAHGEHYLTPTVVELLERRRRAQADERAAAPRWATHTYDGVTVSLVFTTPTGGLVLRQTVTKLVKQAAKTAGVAADLGTHAGRRTVVTSLYVDGGEALDDIARYVGHAKASTTAGYVKRLGRRPASGRQARRRSARPPGRREHRRGSESVGRSWQQPWQQRRRTGRRGGGR